MPGPIALFLPSLRGGGAERAIVDVARGLAESGLEVDLVVAHAAGTYVDRVPAAVRTVDLGKSRLLAALPGLVGYLRRRRPRVLLTAMIHSNLAGLLARRLSGLPCRVVISERVAFAAFDASAPLKFRLVARLRKRFYPRADAIIAVSSGVADELVETCGLPRERISVIPNPVVTPELAERARRQADHPWLEPGSPPLVLAAGRLKRQKNFVLLIEAFARVRERRRARLLILGEGPERGVLESLVERRGLTGDVQLPGFVENPYAFMSRAGVFVLSSDWEGLPGVLIEAMAVGCPVVSTDCPAGPREILDGGRIAPLVAPGDVLALASAIGAILDEPPPVQALIERAQDYTLARVVPRYREVLGV